MEVPEVEGCGRRLTIKYDFGADWGKGAWAGALEHPTPVADFKIGKSKSKLPIKAFLALAERIPGWTLTELDRRELESLEIVMRANPSWQLVLESDREDQWQTSVVYETGTIRTAMGKATHVRPNQAVIRALNAAVAKGARFV